jgi:hypothetical protein
VGRGGEGPPNLIFCDLKPHNKISKPYDNPFWEKRKTKRRKERKRKNAINSGQLVL